MALHLKFIYLVLDRILEHRNDHSLSNKLFLLINSINIQLIQKMHCLLRIDNPQFPLVLLLYPTLGVSAYWYLLIHIWLVAATNS